jgi:branched-chain amino acid transport system substrate-binding protein
MVQANKPRRGRRRLVALATVGVGMAVAACGSSSSSGGGGSSGPIQVGGLTLLTGEFATFGQGALQGLKAGVDEVNSNGGVNGQQFKLVVADSTSDPVDAIPAAKKIINIDKVVFEDGVAGPLADATVNLFTKQKIPFLTPGGDVNFDKNTDPYVWRLTPSDTQLGVAMALYAKQQGYKTAALLFTNGSTATGLGKVTRAAFEHLGGTITSDITVQPDLSSYSSEVSKTVASNPDVILVEMDAATSGVVFREMRSLNSLNTPMIGTDEDVGADFVKAVGADSARKVLVSIEGGTFDSPAATTFTDQVKKVDPGKDPLANASYTYDGIILAALAMVQQHATDSAAVQNGIPQVSAKGGTVVYNYKDGVAALNAGKKITYVGASGPFDYDKYHNVFGPFIAVKLNADGSTYQTVSTLKPEDLASATP